MWYPPFIDTSSIQRKQTLSQPLQYYSRFGKDDKDTKFYYDATLLMEHPKNFYKAQDANGSKTYGYPINHFGLRKDMRDYNKRLRRWKQNGSSTRQPFDPFSGDDHLYSVAAVEPIQHLVTTFLWQAYVKQLKAIKLALEPTDKKAFYIVKSSHFYGNIQQPASDPDNQRRYRCLNYINENPDLKTTIDNLIRQFNL